jgi:hypothetical protein
VEGRALDCRPAPYVAEVGGPCPIPGAACSAELRHPGRRRAPAGAKGRFVGACDGTSDVTAHRLCTGDDTRRLGDATHQGGGRKCPGDVERRRDGTMPNDSGARALCCGAWRRFVAGTRVHGDHTIAQGRCENRGWLHERLGRWHEIDEKEPGQRGGKCDGPGDEERPAILVADQVLQPQP